MSHPITYYLVFLTTVADSLTQTGQHRLGVCERLGICLPPNCLPWYHFQTSSLQIVIALQQYIMSARGMFTLHYPRSLSFLFFVEPRLILC
jgi:hypothetical protein